MADWVKLDPVELGEWLGAHSSSRERGEWVFGFQAGALGAMLRPGATKPEVSGHAKGAQLRKDAKDDKDRIREKKSEAGKQGNAKRWGGREPVADPSQCDGDASRKPVAVVSPGEERRGEENFPKGGNGDPSPSNEIPVWKVIQSERENKAESARRKIADLRPSVDRWEAMGDRLKPDAKERLEKARADIRALETEIYGYGLKP